MGGLVSRAALKELGPEGSSKIARLIMLGTPNHGSFAPVKALTGHHGITKTLALIDLNDDALDWAERIFRGFDGLLQMMPAPHAYSETDLYSPAGWPALDSVPGAPILDKAKQAWVSYLEAGNDRMVVVAGVNQDTTVSATLEENDFRFRSSLRGDGTVPLDFAELDGVGATYYVEGDHMWLPFNASVIRGVKALLRNEIPTTLTPPDDYQWPADASRLRREAERPARGSAAAGQPPVSRATFPRPPALLLPSAGRPQSGPAVADDSVETIEVSRTRQYPVEVTLAKGDICSLNCRALAVGVFQNVRPSGASRALDQALDGTISSMINRRMYDAGLGQVFVMPATRRRLPAEYVVFVGLGDFDQFDEHAQRIASCALMRTLLQLNIEDVGMVLFGGGSGFHARTSLAQMVRGFIDAVSEGTDGRIRAVTLCEANDERYRDMCVEMKDLLHTTLFDDIKVFLKREDVPESPAAFLATRAGEDRGVEPVYLMLRVEGEPGKGDFVLQASVLPPTARAAIVSESEEVKADAWAGIQDLLNAPGGRIDVDRLGAEVGKCLGEGVRSVLAEHPKSSMVLVHDARASVFPWESLAVEDDTGQPFKPAVTGGIHRFFAAEGLAAARWRVRPSDDKLNILLVVNPTNDLAGTETEAEAIVDALDRRLPEADVHELRGDSATRAAIVAELRKGIYDVLHYAGHAFFDPVDRGRCGLICANDEILTATDIRGIEFPPALVLLNACESARLRRRNPNAEFVSTRARVLEYAERVSLGEGFLRAGVANLIGTYWPVGDAAAADFAGTLYEMLCKGKPLGESVLTARKELHGKENRDWADYMLFGSPDFRL